MKIQWDVLFIQIHSAITVTSCSIHSEFAVLAYELFVVAQGFTQSGQLFSLGHHMLIREDYGVHSRPPISTSGW